jgi:uncharacterized protein
MANHGDVWWTELMTHDVEASRTFYANLLGWKTFVASRDDMGRPAKPGEPSYTMFMKGEMPVCGAFELQGPEYKNMPSHWFTYFAVADVDSAVTAAVAAGAKVHRPPFDVPGVGRIAIIEGPDGAHVGLGTPAAMSTAASTSALAKKPKAAAKAKKMA